MRLSLGVGPSPTVFADTRGCPSGYSRDNAGLCRSGQTVLVPPTHGVPLDTARNACDIAKGAWNEATGACGVIDAEVSPPCGFFSWMFGGCEAPGTAAELQAVDSGQYTNYKIAQFNPEIAAENVAANEASAVDDITALRSDCAYRAVADYPTMSNALGPNLMCQLTDPFNSHGWLIYAALGFGAYLLLKGIKN